MNHYLLSIYQPDGVAPPPDALAGVMERVNAVIHEAKASGAWVFNGGLQPADAAAVVQIRRGQPVVTDGPYSETKEHIGGLMVVRASDRGAALEWGRKLARALTLDSPGESVPGLPIEVREFQPH